MRRCWSNKGSQASQPLTHIESTTQVHSYLNVHPENIFEIISINFTVKNPAFSTIDRNVTGFGFDLPRRPDGFSSKASF